MEQQTNQPAQAELNTSMQTNKRKRRFGDRPDGYRLRSLQPMSKVSPYIMPDRSGASVYFHDSFEVTEVENYIRKKRNQGLKGFGVMHVLIAAYVRIISQRPAVNRFLSGQRVYSHGDDIIINLEEQIEIAQRNETYFQSLSEQLEIANYQDALDIREELIRGGYLKEKKYSS